MIEEIPIRILIVDNHAVVREGLVALLTPRQRMEVIAQANNGQEAVDRYRDYQPDITLMDLRMPQLDGLSATRAIISEFPLARIIILTTFEGEEENSLQAGAKALVLKQAPREELFEVIRRVHRAA